MIGFINWIKERVEKSLLNADQTGESSTRLVWLATGLGACISATGMTFWGVAVYVWRGQADSTYWIASGALWTTIVGLATSAKNVQKRQENSAEDSK